VSFIAGIDLGTTHSAIAVVEAGMPGLLADADGRRLMPSVVHYSPTDEIETGREALNMHGSAPESTIYSIKRFIGLDASAVEPGEVPYAIGGNPLVVQIKDRRILPEEVSAEILKTLKAQAEAALEQPVERAVITVPAYFNDAQRQATKRAGELASFTVERIINEPTAAALACGLEKLPDGSRVAVYDLGGGTFDLSILELNKGVFQVLATHGNTKLGGDDIDRRFADWIAGFIGMNIGAEGYSRLRVAVEQAKVELSTREETTIYQPFLTASDSYQGSITRQQLEEIARPVIEKTRPHCFQALADAGLKPSDLQQVILVGGQTRMPLVRRMVAEWFECAEYEEVRGDVRLGSAFHEADGPVLNTSVNPDEAVALGAAIQGAILNGDLTDLLLLDVTPLSLGLETFGGLTNVIIPRNTTIPTKAGELFTNAMDGQRAMLVHVLQGEREKAADNWSLGRFELAFEKAKRGAARVGVQFEIDADGILHVLARDTATGREKIVEMKSAVDVDDEKVQEMVEESVEHAFADMDARRWIEASLKAKESLKAADAALAEFGDQLEDPKLVRDAMEDLENALESEDLAVLMPAMTQLDVETMPLADLMMDAAMEAMLRQRGLVD